MFMKVATSVFLCLMRVRFLQSKSVSQIIRSRYDDTTIRRLRKFEKIKYPLRKAEVYFEFLLRCRDNNIIPGFFKILFN